MLSYIHEPSYRTHRRSSRNPAQGKAKKDVYKRQGVHTGDSITVAPIQTLTDREYQVMRDASFAVIPVSYTHLDVYKRQILSRPLSMALM